ncbi:hypothetical protein HJC23_004215 [Cyclotella cryptica]|uniref:Uncharacterized protein n=1 Tax=Cyclotella cryptica TaxID=29204 RepID=A0ABD3Q7J9_9STRA|eukprot:CCRYP_007843-RA/>CCRYP_007843-RA protein AED:0.05 eAED:0.05 QI:113/1/1/1/1/1/3/222/403
MFFRFLAFLATITLTTATLQELSIDAEISATSQIGRTLLSKARSLENNNADFSWVSGYSIKFVKCATSQDYFAGQYFGGNNNNNNNNKNDNRNGYGGMYEERLVHFKLCLSNSCSSCDKGGDYVIDLNEFVEAVVESKLSAQEYNCEKQKERCQYTCQNANDDQACEYQCYANSGLSYCDNEAQNQNRNGNWYQQFDLQEAVNCKKLDIDKDALQYYMYNNGGANQYQYYGKEMGLYVGPYCSVNGKKIMLGVFMDETCSFAAPQGIYNKFSLGKYIPYQTESLVESGCISCAEPKDYDQQNYNDQQDADSVTEVCERLYEESGKCETNMNIYYPNTYACEFIKSLKASGTKMSNKSKAIPAKVFAGLFATTTIIFGGVAYFLHQKVQRVGVSLNADDNGQLA